jgi:hypothetical protein
MQNHSGVDKRGRTPRNLRRIGHGERHRRPLHHRDPCRGSSGRYKNHRRLQRRTNRVVGLSRKRNQDLFAKNIYATNGQFENLAVSHQLCVGATCVTEDQFKSMVAGSGATSQTAAAASASGSGETNAPSGASIVNGEKNMDTASSTPPLPDQQATSPPATSTPVVDSAPPPAPAPQAPAPTTNATSSAQ